MEASMTEAIGVCLGACEKARGEGRWRRLSNVALCGVPFGAWRLWVGDFETLKGGRFRGARRKKLALLGQWKSGAGKSE